MSEEKTYYEKQLEKINSLEKLEDKKEYAKQIDFSKPIEKDEDAEIIKNIRIFIEVPYKQTSIDRKHETKIEFLDLISGREKKWAEATELLVKYIKENLSLYTTKDDKDSEMWVYKEGAYVSQGKSEVKIILRDVLGEWYSIYIANLVIAKLEADTSIDFDSFFKNNHTNEIPLKNGILDLFTRELKPFSPEKIFFNKLPVKYDPEAKCPKIEEFLEAVLPYGEDKKIFYEIGGFCLFNEYIFEKAFMFIGDGRNGKDKSLELIKRVLGIENCASVPLNILHPDSFAISELFGKKANLAGEISNHDLKDTSTLKALTGRSLLSANRKSLRFITFVNYAKLIFACNELPMVYDTSRGFWDRWIVLEFPNTFVSQQEYDSSEDKNNLKIKDPNIIEKITTQEELSGLLNKFLDGLNRLFNQKGFSPTKGTEEVKGFWIRKSNSFIAFCMDNIESSSNGKIETKTLRKKYSDYCKEHKIKSKSDIVIKRILQEEFGAEQRQSSSDFGLRFWEGIKWKENENNKA